MLRKKCLQCWLLKLLLLCKEGLLLLLLLLLQALLLLQQQVVLQSNRVREHARISQRSGREVRVGAIIKDRLWRWEGANKSLA